VARSINADVETLLDEFARRHARGEGLDVEGLLRQAGPDADELALLIDRFLERAPRQEPSDDAREYVQALEDPPLLNVRRERRLKVDDVVDSIMSACELPAVSRGKVRRYYQMLEAGTLDPLGVAARVWDVLAEIFGRRVEALARDGLIRPGVAAPAMYRRTDAALDVAELAASPRAAIEAEPRDEIDELFLGRSE
jgi:hypothetical protein